MVYIHDRRPLVLAPEHAREWVDPENSAERAAEIAKECCRPTADFTWYEVSKDVGDVRNQGPRLIDPKKLVRRRSYSKQPTGSQNFRKL